MGTVSGERAQAEFASDGDGLVAALGELLREEGNIEEMSIGELLERCRKISESRGFIFPRSCQSLGRRLTTMRRVIEVELGVRFQESKGHAGARKVSLVP